MRHDEGTSMIETGLVALVVFVLLFGILEVGYLYRDYQITSDAVSDGSRTGALLGPNRGEDGASSEYHIIRSLRDATGSMPSTWVKRIVVFKGQAPRSSGALSPEEQVPPTCKAGTPVTNTCNVYNDPNEAFYAVETGDTAYFDCPSASPACSWPASTRRDGPTVGDIEYVGVWLEVERPYLTKLFGQAVELRAASVTRIEVGALTG